MFDIRKLWRGESDDAEPQESTKDEEPPEDEGGQGGMMPIPEGATASRRLPANWREFIPCLAHSVVNCRWCKLNAGRA